MSLDLSALRSRDRSQYATQLNRVRSTIGFLQSITDAVDRATQSIRAGCESLVIYGEPQSGKTEMMICLTAKLLDEGFEHIVLLVNDNIDLQSQNLERFRKAGLSPAPRSLQEIKALEPLKSSVPAVVFCKKNPRDLEALLEKLRKIGKLIVIDDEADYATPDSKVNTDEQSKINSLVDKLRDPSKKRVYIGVTATPARLNLNNTFENDSSQWVYFRPYPQYHGHHVFFPLDESKPLQYDLVLLPDDGDQPGFLTNALTRFVVNVAHLNIQSSAQERNFCMLVHTSGLKDDHEKDRQTVEKFFDALEDENHRDFQRRYEEIYEDAKTRYSIDPLEIVKYVSNNRSRKSIKVINSAVEKDLDTIRGATDPQTPFTVAIGGNIISRGMTFNRLLTMFFTRTTKHKIQQDTYIQRARMFGNRSGYLDHFELHIPRSLYRDWYQAFMYHGLSMSSIAAGKPLWLESSRVRPVSPTSVDKENLSIDKGEISFPKTKIGEQLLQLTATSKKGRAHLDLVLGELPNGYVSEHVLRFVESMKAYDDAAVVVHSSRQIKGSKNIDEDEIARDRGLFGGEDYEVDLFRHAVHHFKIFFNRHGQGRLVYSYRADDGRLKILTTNRGQR